MSEVSVAVDSSPNNGLREVAGTVARKWWVLALTTLLCGLLALGFSVVQDPIYRSNASLYVTVGSTTASPNAYQDSLASQQRVLSYGELSTSDVVIDSALRDSGLDLSREEAKASVRASSKPDTVLLTVSAESTSRDVSVRLADAVAASLTSYVRELESPPGSTSGTAPLAKVTIVSPAAGSATQVSPRPVRNTVLGLLAGVLLGLAIIFVRDRLDRTIHGPDGLSGVVDSPVIGLVPGDPALDGGGFVDFGAGGSVIAESYRRIRTNLAFAAVDPASRRILVTSASVAEGKTTTAINVAASLAEYGHRVVLVDADLRRPTVARRLMLNGSIGLTDYLIGQGELPDLLQAGGLDRLDVLATGQLPPNPAELLGSSRARELFDKLADSYDYVIVDTPPILPVSDGAVVSQWVPNAILVVRADSTKRPELAAAWQQWKATNVRVVGVVVNDASDRAGAYHNTYYGDTDTPRMAAPGSHRRDVAQVGPLR